ncbi:hypothetical protein EDD11_005368 [Mortierella claussenii]|nr:hypothetical protein EDD11_005368 [Mortierella claussenii]
MKALIDAERQQLMVQQQQQQHALARHASNEHPSPQSASSPSPSLPLSEAVVAPKLIIMPTAIAHTSGSVHSSAASSPTSSTSSTFASIHPHDSVSFSFSSPLFYDQKLYIYQSLLKLYRLLAQYIEEHPNILSILQYSIATIHSITVYLLSVILSIAQLVMITATVENLDWIQNYKPLMCEWDSCFPGFVFPTMDIESECEDEVMEDSQLSPSGRKGGRYWNSRSKLKTGDDQIDDGYHSEESRKRMSFKQSMNSTLRRRLSKYPQWFPILWSPEESTAIEEAAAELKEEDDNSLSQDSDRHYSSRISRALVRTISGHLRPQQSKHVTFNEQVLVFGRRRSSQAPKSSPTTMPPMSPIVPTVDDATPALDVAHPSKNQVEPVSAAKEAALIATTSVGDGRVNDMIKDDTEFQRKTAMEDTNGSGASSPVFQPDLRRTSTSPASSISSPIFSTTTSRISSMPVSPVIASFGKDSTDLRRSTSVPLKIGSFLHRHQNNTATQKGVSRRSGAFSETSATVHPSAQPITEASVTSLAAMAPQQESKLDTSLPNTPRTSLSLGTRAKRSFSLVLPRHGHQHNSSTATGTDSSDNDSTALGRQDSVHKHKNFMYRIVHPQRYKRELEQHLSAQERQRLLNLVELQHRILESDGTDIPEPLDQRSNAALCGNAYYYATSAEYVEGLGAPNSVISTSIGTSFPEELQPKRNKSRNKQPRPVSYDHAFATTATYAPGCGYSSEGDLRMIQANPVSPQPQAQQHQPHKSLFKRGDSKKNESSARVKRQRTQTPNRLQQLFSHPGHKQSQSTSSLINPPGSLSAASATAAAASASVSTQETGGATTPPVCSSPAAAGAHRLLSRARSNSRNFTSFQSLGIPADPPSHSSSTLSTPSSGMMICSMAYNDDPAMAHTSFAAFGFPSPNQSPIHSAPASPRHSTSSMPMDIPSRVQAMNDFHGNVARRGLYLDVGDVDDATYQYGQELRDYHQQQQPEQEVVEEGMMGHEDDEDGYYAYQDQYDSVPQTEDSNGVAAAAAASYFESNHDRSSHNSSKENLVSVSMDRPEDRQDPVPSMSSKPHKGLGFMRKLSFRKKKQHE